MELRVCRMKKGTWNEWGLSGLEITQIQFLDLVIIFLDKYLLFLELEHMCVPVPKSYTTYTYACNTGKCLKGAYTGSTTQITGL